MTRVVLSIGSNVGDSLGHLRSVADALGSSMIAASPVYSSAPWGGVEQQDFLNAVVVAEHPTFDPRRWLEFAREREAAADRVRVQRWGPRSLDVDLVVCREPDGTDIVGAVVCREPDGTDIVGDDPELLLPHPRAHQRAFVLLPWLDVEPDAVLTVDERTRPIRDWLSDLDDDEKAGVRVSDARLDTSR